MQKGACSALRRTPIIITTWRFVGFLPSCALINLSFKLIIMLS